jgi:hypothetical protein
MPRRPLPDAALHERALHRAAAAAVLLLAGGATVACTMFPAIPLAPDSIGPQAWFLAALLTVLCTTGCALALITEIACDHLSHIDLRTRRFWRAVYTLRYALPDHPDVIDRHQALNRDLAGRRATEDWLSFAIAARRIVEHPATRHRFVTRCAFFDRNLTAMLCALDILDRYGLTASASASWWWDDVLRHAHAIQDSRRLPPAVEMSTKAAAAALRARLGAPTPQAEPHEAFERVAATA